MTMTARGEKQYLAHNRSDIRDAVYRCECWSCVDKRLEYPREAALLDGQLETERREHEYLKARVARICDNTR